MCTRYPIINRVSELKVHIELTRFVQPEKIEIDANERAVNEKSPYCFFVCTTFDSFLNDLQIDETFAPRNAVDGVWANISHGKFPYQSWGTNKRDDAEWKLLHPIKDWAKINLLVQHCLNISD